MSTLEVKAIQAPTGFDLQMPAGHIVQTVQSTYATQTSSTSSSFHRHVVVPSVKTGDTWGDTDISGEDARVQAVANATWTDSVKTAYQEMVDAQSSEE